MSTLIKTSIRFNNNNTSICQEEISEVILEGSIVPKFFSFSSSSSFCWMIESNAGEIPKHHHNNNNNPDDRSNVVLRFLYETKNWSTFILFQSASGGYQISIKSKVKSNRLQSKKKKKPPVVRIQSHFQFQFWYFFFILMINLMILERLIERGLDVR